MVIDTSAIIAILINEAEREIFTRIVAAEPTAAISIMTFYEASIVTASKTGTPRAAHRVDEFVSQMQIDIVPSTIEDAVAAREAYFRYGRGYHPAGLNLADCFAYALARTRDEPLLFKGDDFSKTDIVPAWRP
jgi:ribonuclease VapC